MQNVECRWAAVDNPEYSPLYILYLIYYKFDQMEKEEIYNKNKYKTLTVQQFTKKVFHQFVYKFGVEI